MITILSGLVGMALMVSTLANVDAYLERSAMTDFSGEQLISCETPDGPRTAVLEVAQHDGTVTIWTDDGGPAVVVGAGSATLSGTDAKSTLFEVTGVATPSGYQETGRAEVTYLGRPAAEVSFAREGIERVRFTIDAATEVVVRMRTYAGDGGLYCDRRLLSFNVGSPEWLPEHVASEILSVDALSEVPESYPGEITDLHLLDAYPIDGGTLAYYSDGLFSVGVVITSKAIDYPEEAVVRDGSYRWIYQPGIAIVTWPSREGNVVVMGDLPPDLLEVFVAELPEFYEEGLLGRLFRRWFR